MLCQDASCAMTRGLGSCERLGEPCSGCGASGEGLRQYRQYQQYWKCVAADCETLRRRRSRCWYCTACCTSLTRSTRSRSATSSTWVKTNLASPSDARTVRAGVWPRKCVFGIPISSAMQSSCRYSWLSAPHCGARRRCRDGVTQHGP